MTIDIINLSCGYDEVVFSNVCFSVRQGESVCILGSNGIGKTTLFKTVLNQLPILDGKILVNNKGIEEYSRRDLAKIIAYVPQAKSYSYDYSVMDILLMGTASRTSFYEAPNESEYEMAEMVLENIGMASYSAKNYSLLSGGEQQMVLIGRAIMQKSKFILLDEPASNLDFANQKILIDLIKRLKTQNVGVLMVTHNPEHAFVCCEHTLMLNNDGSSNFGISKEIITESNLKKTYGVEMTIIYDDNDVPKTCCLKE